MRRESPGRGSAIVARTDTAGVRGENALVYGEQKPG